MTLKPTRLTVLVAVALQQLSLSGFAQAAPAVAFTPQDSALADSRLPEIRITGQQTVSDFVPGTATIGGKVPTALRDIPQSLTVINRAVMESQGVASFQEALRNVPGITIGGAEGGQIGNNINLRGFSARTDIFLDGARDRGQYYRDTYYLEAIEVLKGPSSMLFGRGSTGGIINQVSKQALLKDQNEVSATVGTGNYLRTTGDFNRRLSDTAAFRIEVMGQSVATTRDVMKNQDFGVAPSLRLGIGTPTEITLSAMVVHNHDMADYGVPGVNGRPVAVPRNTFYGLTDDRTLQDVLTLGARIEHAFTPDLKLRNQTQFSHYRTDARESAAGSVGTVSNGVFSPLPTATTGNTTPLGLDQLFVRIAPHDRVIADESIDNQTDLIATFTTGTMKHTLIAGAEISHDLYDNLATVRTNLPVVSLLSPVYTSTPANSATTLGNHATGNATSLAAYLNDTLELNAQWKLVGGLRWDRFKAGLSNTLSTSVPPVYAASQSVSFTSVRTGVIYQPTPMQSYYASYGTSFNPSLETLTVTSGQQAAPPEKNRSFELGTKWDLKKDQLSLTAAVFSTEKTNARSLVSTGVYQLDGDVRVTGVELGVAGKITPKWQVVGGYTHLNPFVIKASGLDNTQGKVLANTPRNNATLWNTYTLTKQWEIGGGFTYMSDRFASNTDVVSAAGYTRWDATLAYHQPAYDVRLNVLNLTNKNYIDGLIPSDGGRSVPGVGRAALVTVAYRF